MTEKRLLKSEAIRAELLALQESSDDGMLHVGKVHAWAQKNRRSAIAQGLIWDDKKAGYEFRLDQIRRMIQIHVIMLDRSPQLVNLSIDRVNGGGYRKVSDVLSDQMLSERMLEDALKELDRVRLKYERVSQLTSVWKEVDRVRTKAAKKRPGRPRKDEGESRASL